MNSEVDEADEAEIVSARAAQTLGNYAPRARMTVV